MQSPVRERKRRPALQRPARALHPASWALGPPGRPCCYVLVLWRVASRADVHRGVPAHGRVRARGLLQKHRGLPHKHKGPAHEGLTRTHTDVEPKRQL
jgi:hypothetical protein